MYCKNWFSDRAFYYHCCCWHWKSVRLHTLFDKYLDHLLVKLRTKSYGPNTHFFAFWQEMVRTFWQNVDRRPLGRRRHFGRHFCDWNNCLMLNINSKTIVFQCFKNYGTPTIGGAGRGSGPSTFQTGGHSPSTFWLPCSKVKDTPVDMLLNV